MNAISVIVPTLNEVDNIDMLVSRIAAGFASTGMHYEIVFVDDNSTDGTPEAIKNLSGEFPIQFYTKKGERGKAHSLLEGFAVARYDTLCMIDADLQYPPEAIVPMYQLMESTNTDIVLTQRHDHATSRIRKVTSTGFNFVFTKMLFGFDYDSQSGLKLFKRSVIDSITLTPTPWSFDLEFIVRSLEHGYKIVSYDIPFAARYAGVAKIQVSKVAVELARASVKLRLNSSPSKVKQNYRRNNRSLQRLITASAVAIGVGFVLALTNVFTAHALSLSEIDRDGSNIVANFNKFINSDNTSDLKPQTTATYPATSQPVHSTTVTEPTTPILASPTPQPVSSNSSLPPVAAPSNGSNSSSPTSASPNTTGAGTSSSTNSTSVPSTSHYRSTPSGASQSTATTPDAVTSPDTQTTSPTDIRYASTAKPTSTAYAYPEHQPSRAVSLIRPLGLSALVLLAIGVIGYAVMALFARFKLAGYQSQQTSSGSTES